MFIERGIQQKIKVMYTKTFNVGDVILYHKKKKKAWEARQSLGQVHKALLCDIIWWWGEAMVLLATNPLQNPTSIALYSKFWFSTLKSALWPYQHQFGWVQYSIYIEAINGWKELMT